MDGILKVEQTESFVRIELQDGFALVLNSGGMIVVKDGPEMVHPHAHLDWEAAGQVARTIMSSRNLWRNT
jgi:hypothetical protein